ncbi:MAG: lysophospholipid acyltransferase family protein [Parvibaculum sp.]|nr:lysophospholipid acyltransferase family protein [Parvibaculum sp.]
MREKNWKYKVEELVLRFGIALIGLPGLDRASAIGGWLGRTIGPRLGITRRAKRRIARAMPELSEAEIERITIAMWDNLGRVAFEYAYIDTFRKPEEAHRIEVVGMEELRAHQAAGHGGLLLSGHFGNFELLPVAMNREGFKGGEVYRPANNPYVNDWMLHMRSAKTGSVQIPKGRKGTRDLLSILRNNGFVAMLFDQKMNEGIEVTLFGIRSMTTPAPAGLAIRLGTTMFPAYIERLKGAHFRVTLYPSIKADPAAEPMGETVRLTQMLNDFLEARIREKPENWFWLHNRWADKD